MNKKLLFATLSLAALAACTDNDFESQSQKVAEEISPVQFEIVNGNDALTRASMGGTNNNTISWSATDKDLFTLYHGAVAPAITGFENAIYTATPVEGSPAVLTTPSMIKEGGAIMVWPADTTFRIKVGDDLTIKIPAEQTDIANQIPYVSDLIAIGSYIIPAVGTVPARPSTKEDLNRAGYDRKYPVYMRPMASQLNVFAKYEGTTEIDALVKDADDPIAPITVESVALLTDDGGTTKFSTVLPVTFTDATTVYADAPTNHVTVKANWNAKETKNAWTYVTGLDKAHPTASVARLETTCPIDDDDLMKGCKFLILPQADIPNTGLAKAAIEVNTYYGQVLVAKHADYAASKYTDEEYEAAWYRYLSTRKAAADDNENASATTGETINGKTMYKTVAKSPALGLRQTINTFSNYVVAGDYTVAGEYMGVASDRYVNVNLAHLDMSALHIKSDQQLRDVVRVWDALGLETVTVFLDGDANNQFEISQKTIAKINEINTAAAEEGKSFSVKPCDVAAHKACNEIVIKDGGSVPDLAFIVINGTHQADVVLKAGQSWSWSTKAVAGKKAVTVAPAATTGIKSFINKGTFANAAATIAIYDNAAVPVQASAIPFVNDGTWNVTAGDLTVQFDVTNNGKVNISAGAEYHQDIIGANKTTFINEATDLPTRFDGDDNKIGVVNNYGVFACTGTSAVKGEINNYGLIEHKAESAKTYITKNQNGGNFHSIFAATNKMGRINLPYDNRNEDNISISAAANEGFVSVTVSTGDGAPDDGKLDLSTVGTYVNYCIVKSGVTEINKISAAIKYLEFDAGDTEIAWTVAAAGEYTGLMVLSPVNIKLGTTLTVAAAGATYIDAKMYVGGTFTNTGGWSGYYGDTTDNVVNNYITY